jgi:hypothetical protein
MLVSFPLIYQQRGAKWTRDEWVGRFQVAPHCA